VSTPFPPHQDPTSPLFGSAPTQLGPTMTDVIVAPSTNVEKPWRYLIGYAYLKPNGDVGFDSHVVERATPPDNPTRIQEVIGELPRGGGKAAITNITQMAGPAPLVHRVPVTTGPTAATHPYRYLVSFYGASTSGRSRGFGTFVPEFDVIISGPEHLAIIKGVCASNDGYDPDKTHIIGYTLLAGPAL
jgi:hypothetical protein